MGLPVRRLSTHISNTWLLEGADGARFLVDTGHALERPALQASLWRAGVRGPGDLTAILLTHRHSDHAGNAAWASRRFDCPVICHEADAAVLTGAAPPAPLRRGAGHAVDELLCAVEDRFPAVSPVHETFGLGRWRHGLEVFPAFGHTEGSVILWHEPSGVLFTGDALLTGIPPLRIPRLALAEPAYSLDVARCRDHVRALLRDPPPLTAIASGHGELLTGDVARAVRKLAA